MGGGVGGGRVEKENEETMDGVDTDCVWVRG